MFRIFILIFLTMFLLAGCSDDSRDKAATQALSEAHKQAQELRPPQAISAYQTVINNYPQTEQAEEAQGVIEKLKGQQRYAQSAVLVFERVSTVLVGYQAFTGKLPQSLQDLDTKGYMFDSGYLEEILPEGAELYLTLAAENDATRMWLQQSGQEQVLSRTLVSTQLENLKVDDLQALKTKWQEIAKVGHLTQVRL